MKGLSWLFQLLTGIALVGFVGYHFIATHIAGSMEYGEVLKRFNELKPFYVVFLVVVAYHAFNGLKIIAIELGKKGVSKMFYVLFAVAVLYGLGLLLSI